MVKLDDIAERKQKVKEMEDRGRNIFKGFCIGQPWCKYNKGSKDESASWDVSYTSGSTYVIGEIKERNYDSNSQPDWILEEKKYNRLQEVKSTVEDLLGIDVQIQYINIYKDNNIRIWDITNLSDSESTSIILPKDKVGTQELSDKNTIMLKNNDALIDTTR